MSRQLFRFVARHIVSATIFTLLYSASAFANDDVREVTAPTFAKLTPFAATALADVGGVTAAAVAEEQVRVTVPTSAGSDGNGDSPLFARPKALPVLYASLAALQVMDVVTTRRGLEAGAVEANPAMRGVVGNSAAFLAVKAASAATSIWMAEKLWKRNRTAAIVTMVAVNAGLGLVVSHNASVVSKIR